MPTDASYISIANSSQLSEKWTHLPKKLRKKRQRRFEERQAGQPPLKKIATVRCSQSMSSVIETNLKTENLRAAKSGWVGLQDHDEKIIPSVSELTGPGYEMKLVDWDGRCVLRFFH